MRRSVRRRLLAGLLLLLTSCSVSPGPPLTPEEYRQAQIQIWEIKLKDYLTCEERVGRILVRLLPVTEKKRQRYAWFLVKAFDLSRTPAAIDQALSRIWDRPLPSQGFLVTFAHPAIQRQGLKKGIIIQEILTDNLRPGNPVRLRLANGRLISLTPPIIHTRPVDFQIVEATEPNAWVTPRYRLYVTTALCRTLPDDHELAAVVGHELAHLKRGHLQKHLALLTLRDLLGLGIYALAGQTGEQIYRLGSGFALLKFSRDQEREADFYGLWYVYRAGYDLERASQVWIHLSAVLPPGPPNILSTHPSSAERLARIKKIVKAIQEGKTFEELQGKKR